MSVVRNLATVGSATLLSRLLGFVRDAGVAALLGAGPLADAYVAALQIPNLFRKLLADGALNSAFVPMWLRIRSDAGPEGARRFGGQIAGTILLALSVMALLCILFAPTVVSIIAPGFQRSGDRFDAAITLLRFAVPYIAVAGLAAVTAAVLNAEGRVGAAAGGIAAFNFILVATVAVAALFSGGVTRTAAIILAISFVVAGCLQLALVGAALFRLRMQPDRLAISPSPDVRSFYARALPAVVAAGMPQLVLIAGAIIASPSPSAVAWLYYANRLYELPLGIISTAVAAVLAPRIAADVLARDRAAIATSQSHALEITLGIALPAAVGLAVLSSLIAGVLFEHGAFSADDTVAVAGAVTAIAAGLAGHALEKVFGAISFAKEDSRTPMLAALAGLAATCVVATLAFPRYGHVGIAGAIALSGWVSALLLTIILRQRGWITITPRSWLRVLGIAGSAMLMGILLMVAMAMAASQFGLPVSFIGRLVWLALLIGIGITAYLLSLRLLGIADVRQLLVEAKARIES